MKKIITGICPLLLTALLFISCSKGSNNEPVGPDVTVKMEGILCTNGFSGSIGVNPVQYIQGNGASSVLEKYDPRNNTTDVNDVRLTATGNGTVRMELKNPQLRHRVNGVFFYFPYFGIHKRFYPDSGLPNHLYVQQHYKDPVPETEFIMERHPDDISLFSLESKLHRGLYLNTARWVNAPTPAHTHLVFETGKKYWYFK